MSTSQMFETAMLLLFSAGWFASIATMLGTRVAVRKARLFVGLTLAGYLMGICAKWAAWEATGILSPVIWVYACNATLILLDTALVITLTRATCAAPGAPDLPALGPAPLRDLVADRLTARRRPSPAPTAGQSEWPEPIVHARRPPLPRSATRAAHGSLSE